jgi:hypothetical protein
MVTKKMFSLLHITTIIHIHAMHPKEVIPARISQISEFIHCVQIIQQQYPPQSPEYRRAIIYLIDTKTMPKMENGKIT